VELKSIAYFCRNSCQIDHRVPLHRRNVHSNKCVCRWRMVCTTVSFPQSSGPLRPAVATKGQGSGHGWPNSGGDQTRSRSPGIEQGIQSPRLVAIPWSTQQVLRNAHQRQLGGAHRGCRGVAGHHRRTSRIEADQIMIHRSPRAAGRPGGGRDVLLGRAESGITIADGPVRTFVQGQWRFSLSEMPSAEWRDRLLELAIADPWPRHWISRSRASLSSS